jgi:hypothetical protein
MYHEAIIRNPAKANESKRAVMEGIINSAMLTPTQRADVDGIIKSSVPNYHKGAALGVAVGELAAPDRTKKHIGTVRIPGGRF